MTEINQSSVCIGRGDPPPLGGEKGLGENAVHIRSRNVRVKRQVLGPNTRKSSQMTLSEKKGKDSSPLKTKK